jgi:spoIIIJ-associated protein
MSEVAVGESADAEAGEVTGEITDSQVDDLQVDDLQVDDTEGGSAEKTRDAQADLIAEGDAAADYLEVLLDIADLDGDLDIDVEGDRAHVAIIEVSGGELASLVGDQGEVLDALQDLARLAAAQATGHRSRLMLDIAGHRAQRRADLERLADSAIEEVTETKEPIRLAAMNAFERKVVHDRVTAAGLLSESEGVEPDRRIVIRPV